MRSRSSSASRYYRRNRTELRRYARTYYHKNARRISKEGHTYYLKNSSRVKASARKYHREHKELLDYRKRRTEYARRRRSDPKVRAKDRDRRFRREYGISLMEYNDIFRKQGGVCAIHGEPTRSPLVVDHDHRTGRVRGLLCRKCNLGIGHLGDNPEIVKRASDYLSVMPIALPSNVVELRSKANGG